MADKTAHISIRVSAEVADRVGGIRDKGESKSAAYVRAVIAGLGVLEDGNGGGEKAESAPQDAPQGLVNALRESVATLTAQLAAKDAQIAELTKLADQSQKLQAVAEHQLATARRPWWQRLFGSGE